MIGLLEAAVAGVAGDAISLLAQQADPGAFECWVDPDQPMLGCAADEYRSPIGSGLFGLIIGGLVMFSLYIAADGDLGPPAVITTLFGGALIPLLPGGYQGIAITIMLLGLVGALFAAGVKYVARGGM